MSGAAESIQAAVEVIRAVADVLTADRSAIIEIDNNTPLTFRRIAHDHDHGGFAVFPPLEIPPNTPVVFGSQKKALGIGTGTAGSVSYAGDGLDMLVGWSVPFIGENKTNVGAHNAGLGGPNASRFLVIHEAGVGNQQARMKFMLFIHPPYSLRQSLKEKGVSLRDEGDLVNKGIRVLFPGVTNIRTILPNSTSVEAT